MNINHESHAISRRSFLKASGVVGAAGILAACGGSSSSSTAASASSGATSAPNTTGATPLKEFISWESTNRELESWNMLYSQMASDMNVTTNLWEGLLSFDCYGKAVPSVAKEWSHNEDSSVWTFNLRDDVDWVDVNGEVKAHLTSKDFLVGLEWVLNAAKNQANNTSMPNDTIVGAYEYYELTKEAGDAAADMTYEDMLAAGVGIEAPDDYTLVFTCKELRAQMDIKIFVDADDDDRLMRVMARDIIERGKTVETVIERYSKTVKPMYLQFIEPSKRYADIIIPQGGHNKVAIDVISATIEKSLQQKNANTGR